MDPEGEDVVFFLFGRERQQLGLPAFLLLTNGGCCHKTFDGFGNMRYDTRMEMTVVTDKSLQGGASALKIGGSGDVADLRLNTENQRERGE